MLAYYVTNESDEGESDEGEREEGEREEGERKNGERKERGCFCYFSLRRKFPTSFHTIKSRHIRDKPNVFSFPNLV